MMSRLRLSIVFLFVSGLLFAQENKFEIGVQAGPRLARMYHPFGQLLRPMLTSSQGLFGQYNFSKKFALRMEIVHGKDGYKLDFVISKYGYIISDQVYKLKLGYLTVPLLLRGSFGKKTKFFVNAGPSFGFLYNGKTSVNNEVETLDISQYDKTNISLVTGVGLSIPIQEKFALSFELRNSLGLQKVYKEFYSTSLNTHSLDLLFGFSYKLGAGGKKQ